MHRPSVQTTGLQSSTDMSLHNRHLLQLKVDRCLVFGTIEKSYFSLTLERSKWSNDEPKLIEEWQEYTLAIATLAIKHYSEQNNVKNVNGKNTG